MINYALESNGYMNTALGKALIYLLIIVFGIMLLFYFYNVLTSEDMDEALSEVSTKTTKTKVEGDIDLDFFKNSKFINLKKSYSEQAVFRAGRRNPFEPYD